MSEWVELRKGADYNSITSRYGISIMLARLIRNREIITDEEIDLFLNGTLDNLHDPSEMTDMIKACSLIQQYISDKKRFRIIGDYDVDGICSTYILVRSLEACGAGVDYAIPHRIHDGYGINEHLIDAAHDDGVEVLITCDNGIAAADQIRHACDLGMHVIVTDHHEVPYDEDEETGERLELLPPAEAVVDPHREDDEYPFKGICGAVVAYKLAGILFNMCGADPSTPDTLRSELLQAAALATVCDVMELRDENRIIVREGLKLVNISPITGIRALINASGLNGKRITSYHFGFVIGPALNAAGRLDSASRSLELLCSRDGSEAAVIASELVAYNDTRKSMTEQGVERAIEDIDNSPLGNDRVLVIYIPGIHESVAGLIAGRIRERYEKPSIVFTDAEEGIKGSGRSIDSYNMYEELCRFKHLFTKFGGHRMAAGISMNVDSLDVLRTGLNDNCTLTDAELTRRVNIDIVLPFNYVSESSVEELAKLEPCGMGNPSPVFAAGDLTVKKVTIRGKNRNVYFLDVYQNDNSRYKLKLFDNEGRFLNEADAFYGRGTAGDLCDGSAVGVRIDVIYNPGINEYMGERSLEFTVREYRFR